MRIRLLTRFFLLWAALAPGWLACQTPSSKMNDPEIITRYEALLSQEDKAVTLRATFIKYNALPQFGEANADYRPGILLEGDTIPSLFLHELPEGFDLNGLNGKKIKVRGIFSLEERPIEGDPPFASKRSGSWLYEVTDLEILE